MTIKKLIASAVLLAFILMLAPVPQASADGKASTRNILIGGAAAALLIINHNKKVHQRYAEDAHNQAVLASQRDDAWAAYRSEQQAYNHEASLVADLNREVAYQHNIIDQQRSQIASLNAGRSVAAAPVSIMEPASAPAGTHAAKAQSKYVQLASAEGYGWGTL